MPTTPPLSWPPVPLPEGHIATGLLLQMAHRSAHERLAEALRPLGMDIRHFGILQFLARAGLPQRQLTTLVGVDKSTLVRLVDQLEAENLAVRVRDPQDRRASRITITTRGRRQLAAANKIAAVVGERLFGGLEPRQREMLHQALRSVIQAALDDQP